MISKIDHFVFCFLCFSDHLRLYNFIYFSDNPNLELYRNLFISVFNYQIRTIGISKTSLLTRSFAY